MDRGTWRAAGFVVLLTVVFLTTNTVVAAAADGNAADGAGLLAPLNMPSSEGVPLEGYQLEADGGMLVNAVGQTQVLVMGGLFTMVRLMVGLCCWLIGFVFEFRLLGLLTGPAQDIADSYNTHVVNALGLKGLLLAWAFVFGLILFVRGKVGTGLGEIVLTLVIAALAASAFIRPDYLLGRDGPLDQAHQAAVEVAHITTSSYFGKAAGTSDPCDMITGPARDACDSTDLKAASVARPIQDALTSALVVKPYMLLQYGTVLDPKDPADKAAYEAHLSWVSGLEADEKAGKKNVCRKVHGPAKAYCEGRPPAGSVIPTPDSPLPWAQSVKNPEFTKLLADLDKAGERGKTAAAYAKEPTWDRVGAAVLLLIAVAIITALVIAMALVMLGSQAGDAAAAAAGGIAWVWAMLPGPSRMSMWRWFGVFIVSVMVGFVAAMALPLFGITVDVVFSSSGPDLMVERLIILDAIALAFLAFHRRMLAATANFGQRMATRMRYAKVGGSHLPGDTSALGAALGMHSQAGGGGMGGGGLSVAHGAFGARLRLLGSLAAMSDGTGMPFAPGRLIGDALAEGRRGIAPIAMALRGAHTALIGPKPGHHPAAAALHQAATGSDAPPGATGEMQVDKRTGEILHDPATDRPLLASRVHTRATRLRSYRIAHRTARVAYGATVGLPRAVRTARGKASEFTEDARTQLRVTANQVREDGARWEPAVRSVREGFSRPTASPAAASHPVPPPPSEVTPVPAASRPAPGRQATPWPQPTRTAAPRPRTDNPWPQPTRTPTPQTQGQADSDRLRNIINARRAAARRPQGGEPE
ncbi:hypothetical protein [Streptomyces sp. NBC_00162]|uniref:hypothetical protein n=1 Tax=Streptomyces sp. NBC_00162 TaxID=2903629 RepID=UPI00214BBF0F|nr:hypothetical protein [Streptomyces sp. NBC_00162]UUU37542.1 hypothetical protein JIW86_00505 [Streptomyces sp. NBC_00162]